MNKNRNGILFMLATNGSVDGSISEINSTAANNINNVLIDKNFNGVFLFPKIDIKAGNVSRVILDNDGINTDDYTMHIDGDSYDFTIFGKVDSPVLNFDYAEAIDVLTRINPSEKGVKNEIGDYYNIIEGLTIGGNSETSS